MKKIVTRILIAALIVWIIDLIIIGLKIFSHDYDLIPEAYIGYSCCLI